MAVILDIMGNNTLHHSMELSNQECLQQAHSLKDQKPESHIIKEDWTQVWKVLSLTSIPQSNLITREKEKFFIEEMDVSMDMQMKEGSLRLMICLKYALNLKNINLQLFKNGHSIQFLNLLKTTAIALMRMLHTKIIIQYILLLKKI
jgi:hypothetical protein